MGIGNHLHYLLDLPNTPPIKNTVSPYGQTGLVLHCPRNGDAHRTSPHG